MPYNASAYLSWLRTMGEVPINRMPTCPKIPPTRGKWYKSKNIPLRCYYRELSNDGYEYVVMIDTSPANPPISTKCIRFYDYDGVDLLRWDELPDDVTNASFGALQGIPRGDILIPIIALGIGAGLLYLMIKKR